MTHKIRRVITGHDKEGKAVCISDEMATEILQRDFRNSLKAAFTPEEVILQLENAKLDSLKVSIVSDRHIVIDNC